MLNVLWSLLLIALLIARLERARYVQPISFPLAALVVYPGDFPAAEAERTLVTMLRELGVGFLRFRSDSLAASGRDVRALVLG